jgi:hypothetical protein
LTADPKRFEAGRDPAVATITWNTGTEANGRVYVSINDEPEILFAEGPSGSAQAPWIDTGGSYEFRLCPGDSRLQPLATVTVTRGEVALPQPGESSRPPGPAPLNSIPAALALAAGYAGLVAAARGARSRGLVQRRERLFGGAAALVTALTLLGTATAGYRRGLPRTPLRAGIAGVSD